MTDVPAKLNWEAMWLVSALIICVNLCNLWLMPAEFYLFIRKIRSWERIPSSLSFCKGGVIIYPTDTIYGIGCDLMNRQSKVKPCCQSHDVKPHRNWNLSFNLLWPKPHFGNVKKIDTPFLKILKRNCHEPSLLFFESSSRVAKDIRPR